MIKDIQEKILKLKKEKDMCILAHCYEQHEILEIADFTGDSFGLAQKAAKSPNKNIMMCGVRFMAETVKILSPEKKVYLPKGEAGCPMAEQLTPDDLKALKKEFKGYTVCAYINTTAALKTLCDVCVTSSSAVKIIKSLENDKILFIPDICLGSYVKKNVPEKDIELINGGCPVHSGITKGEAIAAKQKHPNALLLVHPECQPQICDIADFVGSTTEIMSYAKESSAKEFIIGTENSIAAHLGIECPDKLFYPLSKNCICRDMRLTTIADVLHCLEGTDGEEILLDEDTIISARRCIDEMLKRG